MVMQSCDSMSECGVKKVKILPLSKDSRYNPAKDDEMLYFLFMFQYLLPETFTSVNKKCSDVKFI